MTQQGHPSPWSWQFSFFVCHTAKNKPSTSKPGATQMTDGCVTRMRRLPDASSILVLPFRHMKEEE
eukprot:1995116-Prymnesium_polylepis.1